MRECICYCLNVLNKFGSACSFEELFLPFQIAKIHQTFGVLIDLSRIMEKDAEKTGDLRKRPNISKSGHMFTQWCLGLALMDSLSNSVPELTS